jgi:peptidoglycan/LPS O-acetylase OafA/YrhL
LLAIASLTLFVVLMIAAGHATNNPSGSFGLIRMAFCFAAGVSLCRSFQLISIPSAMITTLTLASIVLIAVCFGWAPIGTLSVFGFGGLIFGLAYSRGPVNRLMTTLPVMYLGRVSFSFYIVHLIPLELFEFFVLDAVRQSSIGIRLAALAMVVVTLFLLATLTYRTIEVPFQRLGRRVAARLQSIPDVRQSAA